MRNKTQGTKAKVGNAKVNYTMRIPQNLLNFFREKGAEDMRSTSATIIRALTSFKESASQAASK